MTNGRPESNRFGQQQRRSQIIIVVEANSPWLNWCVVGWAKRSVPILCTNKPICAKATLAVAVGTLRFAHPTARRKFSSKASCRGSCSKIGADRERTIFYLSQCFDSDIECHSDGWRNFACTPRAGLFLVEFVRFPWHRRRGGWQEPALCAIDAAAALSDRRRAGPRAHSY